MTIAPELPGAAELIAHATALGVRCSMGHSDARVCEAEAGFLAGARSATHTFNAMRTDRSSRTGARCLCARQAIPFAEIICDGIHVDPMMVRLFFKAKDKDRIILVTDGISATGMPDGTYMLGDMEVEVRDGRCTSDGVLAGSVLTLDRGVQNLVEFTGASLDTAVAAASRNPSQLMGIENNWGEPRCWTDRQHHSAVAVRGGHPDLSCRARHDCVGRLRSQPSRPRAGAENLCGTAPR